MKIKRNLLIVISIVIFAVLLVTGAALASESARPKHIGKARAKEMALSHAGLTASDVRFTWIELERNAGRYEYEVEFLSDGWEYDYMVDASNGEVLFFERNEEKVYLDNTVSAVPKAQSSSADKAAASSSQAQSAVYIGETKAKQIALDHAKLKESDVNFVRVYLDKDDGRYEYEVEFYKGAVEYDYDIDAVTGVILSFDQDAEYHTPKPATSSSASQASSYIGEAKAKQIALKHANLKESDVTFVRVHLDKDDGRYEYEVEFYKDSVEYDYDIDAFTGEILSFDRDAEYHTPKTESYSSSSSSSKSSDYIGEAKAKQIALKHAGFSESETTRFKIEADYDDGRMEYEIEFHVGRIEYSYDIDAISGKILSYEAEKDD